MRGEDDDDGMWRWIHREANKSEPPPRSRLLAAQARLQRSWFPSCSLCLSEPRTARFDCGHLVCCDSCARLLQDKRQGCPICRAPIGTTTFAELLPVLGRQPTFESVDVALSRLLKTLDDSDLAVQQEALFALCMRAQEVNCGLEKLIELGVLAPLVALVAEGRSDASKACAVVTLASIAPVASSELIAAGAVPAVLGSLEAPAVAGFAALALGSLAENDGDATAAAILSTEHGYAPLTALVANEDVDASVCEAACGALATLTDIDAAHAAVAACQPLLERLRSLQMRKGGDDGALAQAATALLANVEAVDVDPTAAVVAADHHERYVCRADVQPRFDGVPRWLRCVSSVWSA